MTAKSEVVLHVHALLLLILEDNPSDAELMVAELRRAGFEPDWKRVETEADFRPLSTPPSTSSWPTTICRSLTACAL